MRLPRRAPRSRWPLGARTDWILAASIDGKVLVPEADLTDRAQVSSAVERTVAELGRLDTLVNNAGVMQLGPVLDAPLDEWDRMIALNVQAPIETTHVAFRTCCGPPRIRLAASPTSSTSARRRVGSPAAAARSTT